jgi:two-component system cell cycle sensor histidine kinase/response regulator CckA
MTQPGSAAPAARRLSIAADVWPAWYRPVVLLALGASVAVALAAYVSSSLRAGPSPELVLVYLVLPLAIVTSIGLSRRSAAAWSYVAAALLDVEAVLIASRAAIGLAFAIILPFAGLVLVLTLAGSLARRLAFVAAWVASTAGMAVAVTIGPVSQVAGMHDVGLAVAAGAVFIAFVHLHVLVLTELRARAARAMQAEVESRRQAEAELDRTSRLLSAIVDASPVPTQAFATDGSVVLWNPASERVFGWMSGEVVGNRLPAEMTPLEDREAGAERIRRTMAGGVANGERARRLSRDGREVWVDIYAARMVDGEGRTIGVAGQLVDVTERIALEAQLRQAAKMDAIGQLSGGIAHDFNNMLTAIRGNAQLVRAALPADEPDLIAEVDEILTASDRAGDLTRQLLAFARKAAVEPQVLDPAAVVRGFAPMLSRLIGVHIRLALDLAPDTGCVLADRGQLEQVVLNLALNARDSMPDGGTLGITSANDGQDPSAAVVLTVSDTGHGMDDATRARIFEPFFTTKEQGRGTGMGLATVYGIVSMFEGTIAVDSEPEHGTTFTIRIPRVAAAPPEPGAEANRTQPGGTETILLIEDEPAVRLFAMRTLTALGYVVLEAGGEAEAFAHARGHEGPIDLILSDVVLPGTPGPALVRQLTGIRPGAKTLLCSGFAPESSVGTDRIDPGRFLPKPYSQEALAGAVRAALDAAPRGGGPLLDAAPRRSGPALDAAP